LHFFSIKVSKTGLSPLSRSPHRPRFVRRHAFLICAGLNSFCLVWRRTARAGFSCRETGGILVPILFWTRFCEKLFSGEKVDFRKTSAICIFSAEIGKKKKGSGENEFLPILRRDGGGLQKERQKLKIRKEKLLGPPIRANFGLSTPLNKNTDSKNPLSRIFTGILALPIFDNQMSTFEFNFKFLSFFPF